MLGLIRDLEQRKELELRAQIEKEEILRNIKDLDQRQLGVLERERKKELEKLAVERENLRQKEQHMMDEIRNMEMQLVEQERHFKQLRDSQTTATTKPYGYDRDWTVETDIRRKEQELARDRGTRVVEIKANRDKLERERQRILDDLENIKTGGGLPQRRNDTARLVAENSFGRSGQSYIEPSLKIKLTGD